MPIATFSEWALKVGRLFLFIFWFTARSVLIIYKHISYLFNMKKIKKQFSALLICQVTGYLSRHKFGIYLSYWIMQKKLNWVFIAPMVVANNKQCINRQVGRIRYGNLCVCFYAWEGRNNEHFKIRHICKLDIFIFIGDCNECLVNSLEPDLTLSEFQ